MQTISNGIACLCTHIYPACNSSHIIMMDFNNSIKKCISSELIPLNEMGEGWSLSEVWVYGYKDVNTDGIQKAQQKKVSEGNNMSKWLNNSSSK